MSLVAVPAGAFILPERSETGSIRLEVSLSARELYLKIDDRVAETYEVAVGTRKYPTPSGVFTVERVIWNPAWHPPDSKWARGKKPAKPGDPNSPIQAVKIPFWPLYHIHGTDKPESVGDAASHGCIRMRPEEVTRLARSIMERTGDVRDESWYQKVLGSSRSTEVRLAQPIELVVYD